MQAIAPCLSLSDVRQHINRIDDALVALVAERGAYVREAARLKTDAADIPAPARVAEVIARVRQRAAAVGADPAVVEATWKAMIGAFITAEHAAHTACHPPHTD